MKWISFFIFTLVFSSLGYAIEPNKVAVIDTGLNIDDERFNDILCEDGHADFTGTGIQDDLGHGTHVVGLIKKYAQNANYCLIILKYYNPENDGSANLAAMVMAIKEAYAQDAMIVNISGGGPRYNSREKHAMIRARNITFVVAAGNEGTDLDENCNFYPACYNLPNIITVGSKNSKSNYGKIVKATEEGSQILSTLPDGEGEKSGTSMSTAIHTGKLIKERYGKN